MTLAVVFDSVGVGEWFVLLAVVLIVVGPKNLPSTIRKFGNYYAKFRRAAESFKRQLMEMDTELNNAINVAEKEVKDAVSIPDEPPAEGAEAYGREFDSVDYRDGDYMDGDYYGEGGYPGGDFSDTGDSAEEKGAQSAEAQTEGDAAAGNEIANENVNDGDKTSAES